MLVKKPRYLPTQCGIYQPLEDQGKDTRVMQFNLSGTSVESTDNLLERASDILRSFT